MKSWFMAFLLACAACTPIQAQRGQYITDAEMSQLKPGTTAKAEVTALLGTPTTTSPFDAKQWYYIGEETKQIGVNLATPTARRILALTFDDSGTLVKQSVLGLEAAQNIPMRPGATRVIGKEPGLIQQLIGNVGRFNSATNENDK